MEFIFAKKIIIGSGIAGLYYAMMNNLKDNLKNDFIILEKNSYVGGRIKTDSFHGKNIVVGAGVGRSRDKLLKKLLIDLGFQDIKEIKSCHHHKDNKDILDPLKLINHMKDTINENETKGSFENVVRKLYGKNVLESFIVSTGITDYLKEDYRETLYHYGMEDNVGCNDIFYVPWKKLIDKLVEIIGEKNIKLNTKVVNIREEDDGTITLKTLGHEYRCEKLIIATDIKFIHKIFSNNPLYKYISFQPFCRVYTKFDLYSTKIIRKYVWDNGITILDVYPGLQKIIPISVSDGIYMIAYNDNESAKRIKYYTNRQLCTLIKQSLKIKENIKIIDYRIYYWTIGTHYFRPYPWKFDEWKHILPYMKNPTKNIKVIGEFNSFNQGWVEGALESCL